MCSLYNNVNFNTTQHLNKAHREPYKCHKLKLQSVEVAPGQGKVPEIEGQGKVGEFWGFEKSEGNVEKIP